MPTCNEIRSTFLNFFEARGHRIVPSSSLIPFNDPTLLFTNAGMNQFKDVFLGKESRTYRRAATSQKCMRVSGKHNDFKDVGHSTRHHTFFEMLGNFSFGDYFKEDAIVFAWELMTRDFGIDPQRLLGSVYQDDDDAWRIWNKIVGIPSGKIFRLGDKDNFWAMGETGPCGPCSELHYDFGTSPLPDHPDCDLTCSCGRWSEIWNLVFMQYNRDASGRMTPLPSPSIDTGMGFERITTLLQDKANNYETDLFQPLIREIGAIANLEYGESPADDVSMRIIADHARAATFVVADGQSPGNDKRGYVLRKIMRRAVVHGQKLEVSEPFIFRITGRVIEGMKEAYPELIEVRESVARIVKQEEEAFAETLRGGLREFYERAGRIKAAGSRLFPGEEAFFLYDTRGLPLEIIEDLTMEEGLVLDEEAFHKELEGQRERARQDYRARKVSVEVAEDIGGLETRFTGYGCREAQEGTIRAIFVGGEPQERLSTGERGEVVLDETPFYAESGGQVGDTGTLKGGPALARVEDTQYRGSAILHHVVMVEGGLEVGDVVTAAVDLDKRFQTMNNHTATHLLHAALKSVLGAHVKQAGSLVAPDRLRFDFTHFAPLTQPELEAIEDLVNSWIWKNIEVQTTVTDLDSAMNSGAVALFGEKYQDQVRVVEVPGFSRELCGGTHVPATGTIGLFKILGEGSVSSGIRRLEAVTGSEAFLRYRADEELLTAIQESFKVSRKEIPGVLQRLQDQVKELQRTVEELKLKTARSGMDVILGGAREVAGIKVLAHQIPPMDKSSMRGLADELRNRLGSAVVILGAPQNGKVSLLVMVSPDVADRLPAGRIIRELAPLVGGSGGGKAELAEAGGKDPAKLADAIEKSFSIVERMLGV